MSRKHKALEDMTHQDLIEALIYDESITDNVDVCDEYPPDKHGNNMVTLSYDGLDIEKKKGCKGLLLLTFNAKGRLIQIEMATSKKGKKDWQVATSEKFLQFKASFVGINND